MHQSIINNADSYENIFVSLVENLEASADQVMSFNVFFYCVDAVVLINKKNYLQKCRNNSFNGHTKAQGVGAQYYLWDFSADFKRTVALKMRLIS